jgi:hypothetical protein
MQLPSSVKANSPEVIALVAASNAVLKGWHRSTVNDFLNGFV